MNTFKSYSFGKKRNDKTVTRGMLWIDITKMVLITLVFFTQTCV